MANTRSKREAARGNNDSAERREVNQRSKFSVTKRTHDATRQLDNGQRKRLTERDFTHAPHKVRIIGGQWKRSLVAVPSMAGLRPTPDRVRETLFNWIGHLIPDLSAARGLDLFAGTGVLGLELASRGAQRVTLVESNRELLEQLMLIKRKLAADQVDVIAGDALSVAARWPAASFEAIFVDPPFDSGLLGPAISAAARLVSPEGVIYVEGSVPADKAVTAAAGLQQVRESRAGRVFFCLLRPATA